MRGIAIIVLLLLTIAALLVFAWPVKSASPDPCQWLYDRALKTMLEAEDVKKRPLASFAMTGGAAQISTMWSTLYLGCR